MLGIQKVSTLSAFLLVYNPTLRRCFMRFRLRSAVLILSTFLLACSAHAGPINFTLSGADTANIAIFVSGGVVTSITGTFDGSTILALLPVLSIGGNDNVFTGTSPYFDNSGLSFSLVSPDSYGYSDVNLSNATDLPLVTFGTCQANSPAATNCNAVPSNAAPKGDTITLTPEPGTLLLLGAGLAALAGAARFRRIV